MNKVTANLLCALIGDTKKRRAVRRILTNREHESELSTIMRDTAAFHTQIHDRLAMLDKLDSIYGNIQYITSILERSTDITRVPHAVGVHAAVQELMMRCFREFDRVCRKNDLKYWLDFGTLLGGVRHRGFIPWDDDIDIGMPIADFRRLAEIADTEFADTCCRLKIIPSQIGKILHVEFMPETDEDWVAFIDWQLKGKLAFAVDIFPYYYTDCDLNTVRNVLSDGRARRDEIFGQLCEYCDFSGAAKMIDEINQTIASDSGDLLFLGLETGVYQPHVMKTSDVFPLREIEFEGMSAFAPNNYNKILSKTYGDYYAFPKTPHTHLALNELDDTELDKINNVITGGNNAS